MKLTAEKISCYEIEPAYRTGRQEENLTRRDDYFTCELLPILIGTGYPDLDRDKLWQLKNNYRHMKTTLILCKQS